MEDLESGLTIGGIVGLIAGVTLSLMNPNNVSEVKTFQRDGGKPSVMRVYKTGPDEIYVQQKTNESFVPINVYLKKVKDIDKRELEKTEIFKAVNFYYK